jgi:hypothetical protein
MTSNRVPGGVALMNPTTHSELVPNGRVGDRLMPWNAKSDARKLGPGIPKSDYWASAKEVIDQVGCVCAAQGLSSTTSA